MFFIIPYDCLQTIFIFRGFNHRPINDLVRRSMV